MIKRRGLASPLFKIARPMDASAASVSGDVLSLALPFRSVEIPVEKIDTVEMQSNWCWRTIKIRFATKGATISGLSEDDAASLIDVLEAARICWWRQALASQGHALQPVYDQLGQILIPSRYMNKRVFSDLKRKAESAARPFSGHWPEELEMVPELKPLKAIRNFLKDPGKLREQVNAAFIENELAISSRFFDCVEARPLTEEQRMAIVVEEDRNLVVAAAGSGKTSVIVAKAGWLVKRSLRRPSELLLLAFAKDAQRELRERLDRRVGKESAQDIEVRTFHSLGMSIIGEAEGKLPTLARVAEDHRALLGEVQRGITDLLSNPQLARVLLRWFQAEFAPYKSQHEFTSYGAYWDYIRQHEIRSLNGEMVKSFEECEIANFLYLNGIRYEYECAYEHDTATAQKRQYQPDFYLPDAKIYIEHFALTASGRTPPFIDQQQYLESMTWKRGLHALHGTVLIETFSHEHAAGQLLRNLEAKLNTHGVSLAPIPPERAFEVLNEQGRIARFVPLLATFLNHFKGSGLSLDDLARRAGAATDRRRAEAFLQVFQPIFEQYEANLAQRGEIDFHDMIARATDHVTVGRYRSPFGYILVDEFQDISPARARLLSALLDQVPDSQLFAVGDDWQAIFRFAGSDIAIMREFEDRFGYSERLALETTFRCCDRICDVATQFILGNPAQIRKTVRSIHKANGTSVHIGLPGEASAPPLQVALRKVVQDAALHVGKSDVLLLGRYRHNRPKDLSLLAKAYPNLRFAYMTVHGSKGLQADYVVVLGLGAGKYGFPSAITDDPLLDLVLAAPEGHPNAEERRLFYVAITRARRDVYLLADGGSQSSFIEELIKGGYDVSVFGQPPEKDVPCPTCVKGHLEQRANTRDRNTFYGCSNWPYCRHTQPSCPACGTGLLTKAQYDFQCRDCGAAVESCPACEGWLVPKTGRYGRFHGCSNWPDCDYTRAVQQRRRQNTRAR